MGEIVYQQFFIVQRRPGYNAVLDQADTREKAERLCERYYRHRYPDNFILEVVARKQERARFGWAGAPL